MELKTLLKNIFRPRLNYSRPKVPIYLFCYHKIGTILLAKIFREICLRFGWRFKTVIGLAKEIPLEADVILFMHSLVDLKPVTHDYVGVHFIRDPRDIIVSGYLYHKRCSEDWCINESPDVTEPIIFPSVPWSQQHKSEKWKANYIDSLNGMSYQQNLLNKSQQGGLLFEMNNYGAWTIESMLDWNYANQHIKEVRFEAIMDDYDDTFKLIFKYFGFEEEQVMHGLRVARKEDLRRKSDRQLRLNTHISSRETTRWRNYFEQSHKDAFLNNFGNALVMLGYEVDDTW